MYSKYSEVMDPNSVKGHKLQKYHHVRLDAEFKFDCHVWLEFLKSDSVAVVNRPMVDLFTTVDSQVLRFYSDVSANQRLGFGCIFDQEWIFQQWENGFVSDKKPSIEYLELFALCAGIFTWEQKLKDIRITVFCDNQAVVEMVNAGVSSCCNCMYLLRLLVLNNLQFNCRVFTRYVRSSKNELADSLSRLKIDKFRRLAPPETKQFPEKTSPKIWPVSTLWQN